MSTFQKLLGRFLGQVEQSYDTNGPLTTLPKQYDYSSSTLSAPLHRSHSFSKSLNSRKQRSIEALKSASCLTCGISDSDHPISSKSVDTLVPIPPTTHQYNFFNKSLVNNAAAGATAVSSQQQQQRQKRRAKTKLIVIRHGERVDALFGENWLNQAFDRTGTYRRFDGNLPISLPHRQNLNDYLYDPPLTELGLLRSYRTGEALYRTGLRLDYCYSSPALRCVQTADAILDGMKLRTLVPIRVELGLFECGLWHKHVAPHFMSINELVLNRLNIETSYNSIQKSLSTQEDEITYYERSYSVMRQILARHGCDELTILFVGHAPSLETLTRQLIGAQPRPNELVQISQKINYLSLTVLEGQRNEWTFVDAILAKQP